MGFTVVEKCMNWKNIID